MKHFFFAGNRVRGNIYLDMVELCVTPQFDYLQPISIFQQDGALAHWGVMVREFLDDIFPDRWIASDGPTP